MRAKFQQDGFSIVWFDGISNASANKSYCKRTNHDQALLFCVIVRG